MVSVIVPVYNAAPYIDDCIASLLRETLPLEIIVVNDGSTDDTSQKVKALPRSANHSILLLEQPNQGLSSARNAGLRAARGRFLGLVDADDWVEGEMFTTMVTRAIDLGADLVICNGEMVDHQSQATRPFHDDVRFRALAERYTTPVDPRTVPDMFRLDTSACTRLYSRALIDRVDFQFAHGLLFEDVLAHYQLLFASRTCLLLDRPFYKYRINHPGRITDKRDRQLLTIFEVLRRSQDTLRANRATDAIWANFIWFQSWVLRWLGAQIDGAYRREFIDGVVAVGRGCPRTGVIAFQRMFDDDSLAQRAVALQMFGWGTAFLSLAKDSPTERNRPLSRVATHMRRLAPLLGRRS